MHKPTSILHSSININRITCLKPHIHKRFEPTFATLNGKGDGDVKFIAKVKSLTVAACIVNNALTAPIPSSPTGPRGVGALDLSLSV